MEMSVEGLSADKDDPNDVNMVPDEDEDDKPTPVEPVESDTRTAVALLLLLLRPPQLPSRLRRWRFRRKGGRCLNCHSNLVRRLRRMTAVDCCPRDRHLEPGYSNTLAYSYPLACRTTHTALTVAVKHYCYYLQ